MEADAQRYNKKVVSIKDFFTGRKYFRHFPFPRPPVLRPDGLRVPPRLGGRGEGGERSEVHSTFSIRHSAFPIPYTLSPTLHR